MTTRGQETGPTPQQPRSWSSSPGRSGDVVTFTEIAGGGVAVTITGDGGMWTVRIPMTERWGAASVLAAVDGTVTVTQAAAQTALAVALTTQGQPVRVEATPDGLEQLAQVDDALGRPFHVRDWLATRG